ncbi:MAG TPA: Hpt domain-containing protein [Rhodocyclaceae bacterium]|nr:Hpt domain-containing protein [Rhodocyclaceae bacterium]
MNAANEYDLGPLTWVKGEIDQALERADEALQKFQSASDPTQIKFCRTHIHQVHGALAIVGLDGLTQVSESLESLLLAIEEGKIPATAENLPVLASALLAIRQYLDDLMAGEPNQPLRLQPIYQSLNDARGTRVRPSDLFFPDLAVRPPKRTEPANKLPPEEFKKLLKSERMRFQKGLLAWLKNAPDSTVAQNGLTEMRSALRNIEATQDTPQARSFWWISLGFLDALTDRGVATEQDAKQLCARIDLQIRRLLEGSRNVAERLMRDALFYVGKAPSASGELAAQIRSSFRLESLLPPAAAAPVAAPQEAALRKLREVILAAEEFWNKFCAGNNAAINGFAEQSRNITQLTDSIGHTDLKRLAQGLAATASWLAEQPSRHSETAAMEVATAILLLQNAQENFKRLGNDFAQQVDLMTARLQACVSGVPTDADSDLPLLDEMTRRAQEKLLITQVAREIQNNLAQIEQALDAFFRDPAAGIDAKALDAPIKQIAGALTILGHDKALASLHECGERIQSFGAPGYTPAELDFEAVAQQLSTIGFFIDALQTGATDYDLFVRKLRGEDVSADGDEEQVETSGPSSTVEAEVEQTKESTQALVAALKEAPQDSQLKDELKQNLQALQKDADLVADHALGETAKAALTALESGTEIAAEELETALSTLKPASQEAPSPSAETLQLAQASHEELDAELLEIFLEEANEVLQTVATELEALRAQPHDVETLTTIRRSMHTLKGSGRMVGLKDLGEAAWSIEQTLNMWLRQELEVTPELMDLIAQAHTVFGVWVKNLAENTGQVPDPRAMVALSDRLRGSEPAEGVAPPAAAAPAPEISPQLMDTAVGMEAIVGPDDEPEISEEPEIDIDFSLDIPGAPGEEALSPPQLPETTLEVAAESAEAPEVEEADVPPELMATFVGNVADLAGPLAEPSPEPEPAMDVDFSFDLPATDVAAAQQAAIPAEEAGSEDFGFDLDATTPASIEAEGSAAQDAEQNASESLDVSEPEGGTPDVSADFSFDVAGETAPEAAVVVELSIPESEPAVISFDSNFAGHGEETDLAEQVSAALNESVTDGPDQLAGVGGDDAPSPTLYDIFREEARGHLDTLAQSYRDLEGDPKGPTTFAMTRAAHTLGGIAATVGLGSIQSLAIGLEHALLRRDHSARPDSIEGLEIVRQSILALAEMYNGLADDIEPQSQTQLIDALEEIFPLAVPEVESAPLVEAVSAPEASVEAEVEDLPAIPVAAEEHAPDVDFADHGHGFMDDVPQLQDEIDEQLLPIFLEEATDLVQGFADQLRAWRENIADQEAPRSLARLLHTFKGGARMAGAMNLGEATHILETSLEDALKSGNFTPELLEEIESGCDTLTLVIEKVQRGEPPTLPSTTVKAPETGSVVEGEEGVPAEAAPVAAVAEPVLVERRANPDRTPPEPAAATPGDTEAQRAMLRVRADLVDRLVNEAGELSIARARIEGEMRSLKTSLLDLTENVIRLRRQLREVEIQAESQMQSRIALAEEAHQGFDPLEFDRFTRFQELTRFMAESVNDVATVQQTLLKNLDDANAAIIAQARLNRGLQQELMGIRMVPFSSQTDRLYRIVRQTAKELGKRANLEIKGGHVELDRSVLDKMLAPVEHMLRNAVNHGIEERAVRAERGKEEIGEITLTLKQEGNEIVIAMGDDGGGLDAQRIRARAESMGLLAPGEVAEDSQLYDFIFHPGFSTAATITHIAGRGVGMDVVKTEVANLGGRIEIDSVLGKGTTFTLYLPLTLAVTQTLLVRTGGNLFAVPSTMIEQVLELKEAGLTEIREKGEAVWLGNRYPFHYLPHLLGDMDTLPESNRRYRVLLLRSGTQRAGVLVDELKGNQEVVIKNIGPQLARVTGISGATVLGDGRVVLILNPVALSTRNANAPAQLASATAPSDEQPFQAEVSTLPTVMVVDDSLTVRKITSRLLAREGYQVILAKDGVDALEQLIDNIPDVMLSDIEMPRMDGFDLVRNVRADEREALKKLPIIMITSRTADKHRNYALEIGANEYLGKPYDEETLLKLIGNYIEAKQTA